MNGAADFIITAIPGMIVLRGMMARVDTDDAFLSGAKEGLRTGVSILPALTAMMLMLSLMRHSGLTEALSHTLAPVMNLLHLPEEVAPLLLLRPLTGSGSTAALREIFAACGPDSRAGQVASVLAASSETIFYTMTVYLSATDVRRLPWALPVSLAAYLSGAAAAGFFM